MLIRGGWTSPGFWMSLLYSIPAILIALCFHEFAHAFAANKLGDPTARLQGRMTIDPTKHLDLFGTIAILLFGIGWAKPVPVDPRNFKHPRRDDILVSVSGVIMNLIVAFAAYAIYFIGYEYFYADAVFVNIMVPIITINISIAVFNIIPIPPLDGFHIISSLFLRKRGNIVLFLYRYGFIILLVLIFFDVISMFVNLIASPILYLYGSFFSLFS